MSRGNIQKVERPLKSLISDIESSWEKTSKWAIPTAFFFIALMVAWEVIRKRVVR